MKSLFIIFIIVILFLKFNKKEHFASSAAFHVIRLKNRTDNVYKFLNNAKKIEKFYNQPEQNSGFNPSRNVIFPYSSWELKPKFKKAKYNIEDLQNKYALNKNNNRTAIFTKNDAGSGINLDSAKVAYNKYKSGKFQKHEGIILARGGNKAK